MVIEGVDYAWNRPSPAGLVAAGKKFAVRYGGPGSAGKQLDAAELRGLREAGLAVVANAEGTATGYQGTAAGRAWAQAAQTHFRELGMPADRPIYFSVDFDANSTHWPAVDAALHGSADIIGASCVGVYGGYDTIAHCAAAGTAAWFWQTYAWSGGRWHAHGHLQQYRNGVALAGGTVDLTRATTADYGQWGQPVEDDMAYTEAQMRAFPWQYIGGGIPSGYSTLRVFAETHANSKAAVALLTSIAAKVDIDATELAAITAAAKAGAEQAGAAMATIVVDAIKAALPTDLLGRAEVVDAVEEGVRLAFAGGLAPDAPAAQG